MTVVDTDVVGWPSSDGALLDAIPDSTAVLDADGTIVAVNRAWRMFSVDNGGGPKSTGVGTNYFDVCRRAAAAGSADAEAVLGGLLAVAAGGTVEVDFEYPCPAPTVGRWFVMRVTPIAGSRPRLLVSHQNITRRKMAEQDLERQATRDPLTGLANRLLFGARLAGALTLRPGRGTDADVGVLYLDLDGFKPVNDTWGHAAGDEVLQTSAARLALMVRPQDTVARLGGDEFAVLAPRTSGPGLVGLRERIVAALSEPHLIHGNTVDVGASVGAVLAAPGEDPAAVVTRADEAMYAVKRSREPRR